MAEHRYERAEGVLTLPDGWLARDYFGWRRERERIEADTDLPIEVTTWLTAKRLGASWTCEQLPGLLDVTVDQLLAMQANDPLVLVGEWAGVIILNAIIRYRTPDPNSSGPPSERPSAKTSRQRN
mgnify:CR=1 FL=1